MVYIPTIQFNNGVESPVLGLGTWKSKPEEVVQAVKDAIDVGYRLFDCAPIYGNEKEIGQAIRDKIAEGVVRREDLFITSKLWSTCHKPELVEPALKTTLQNLGLEYLDLYLIHWPVSLREGDDPFPKDENGKLAYSDADYLDTWRAMEVVYKKGLARSIGVSNFNKRQIQRLLKYTSVVPVSNQVECHPYLTQKKIFEFCKSKGIILTAYSPLGSSDRPGAKPGDIQLLEDPVLRKIAAKYDRTPAQIALRYQIQRGIIAIPKTVTKSRMKENFEIFKFELTPDDMALIGAFECNGRIMLFSEAIAHREHPFFNDEY